MRIKAKAAALYLVAYALSTTLTLAQSPDAEVTWTPPPTVPTVQEQYRAALARDGQNARYRAAEEVLNNQCQDEQDEYCAKLYTLLGEEALLSQNLFLAKQYYLQVVNGTFIPDVYMEGTLLARVELDVFSSLRQIALIEGEPAQALVWHQRYVDSLHSYAPREADRYRVANDKQFAICYQAMGKSEKAMAHLMPHALGAHQGWESDLDKEMVGWLVDLLRSKYGKRAYRRFLEDLTFGIKYEPSPEGARFYLIIWENRLYFDNDSANFKERVAANPQLASQAIAHYQRKLLNSYFYQRLLQAT